MIQSELKVYSFPKTVTENERRRERLRQGAKRSEGDARPGKGGRLPPQGSKYAPFPTCLWQPPMNYTEHLSFTQGTGTDGLVPG